MTSAWRTGRQKLALPECTLGVLPAYGGTAPAAAAGRQGRAAVMLCTGDPISGEEALACGLCDAVTEPGGALGQAMDIARRIADRAAPLALRGIKACLNGRGRRACRVSCRSRTSGSASSAKPPTARRA